MIWNDQIEIVTLKTLNFQHPVSVSSACDVAYCTASPGAQVGIGTWDLGCMSGECGPETSDLGLGLGTAYYTASPGIRIGLGKRDLGLVLCDWRRGTRGPENLRVSRPKFFVWGSYHKGTIPARFRRPIFAHEHEPFKNPNDPEKECARSPQDPT